MKNINGTFYKSIYAGSHCDRPGGRRMTWEELPFRINF